MWMFDPGQALSESGQPRADFRDPVEVVMLTIDTASDGWVSLVSHPIPLSNTPQSFIRLQQFRRPLRLLSSLLFKDESSNLRSLSSLR